MTPLQGTMFSVLAEEQADTERLLKQLGRDQESVERAIQGTRELIQQSMHAGAAVEMVVAAVGKAHGPPQATCGLDGTQFEADLRGGQRRSSSHVPCGGIHAE
jgi:hypothetical protein